MAYLTLSTVMTFLGFQCPWIIIQFGWFVGWIYLRFYKKNTTDSVGGVDSYGDRSETFSLISWFPPFIQCVFLETHVCSFNCAQLPSRPPWELCALTRHPSPPYPYI